MTWQYDQTLRLNGSTIYPLQGVRGLILGPAILNQISEGLSHFLQL
jgi:hypothetical protein